MKTPAGYLQTAARLRAVALVCVLLSSAALAVMANARGADRNALFIGALVAAIICAGASVGLMARARWNDEKAITEDYFRSRESRAVAKRNYPPTIAPLGRQQNL